MSSINPKSEFINRKVSVRKNFPAELLLLLIPCFIFRCLHYIKYEVDYQGDTVTYFYAAQNLVHGIIDPFRTPAYPLFIKICQYIYPADPFHQIRIFQHIISFITIIPFYYSCKLWINNRYLRGLSTLAYGCMGSAAVYNDIILAESLLMSSFVVLLFMVANYLQSPGLKKGIFINIFIFFMVMLKPVAIYLYGIIGLFWIVKLAETRFSKFYLAISLSFFFSVLLLGGYAYLNKVQNNYSGISLVTHDNNFLNVIDSKAYKAFTDKKLISIIDSSKHGAYYNVYYLNNDYHLFKKQLGIFPYPDRGGIKFLRTVPPSPFGYTKKQLDEQINQAMKSDVFYHYLLSNFKQFLKSTVFRLKGFLVLFLLLIQTGLIIGCFLKKKQIMWFRAFISLVVSGLIVVFILTGFGQMGRILLPILPFLIILVFKSGDDIFLLFAKEKNKAPLIQ